MNSYQRESENSKKHTVYVVVISKLIYTVVTSVSFEMEIYH